MAPDPTARFRRITRRAAVACAVLIASSLPGLRAQPPPPFDLLITGARLVDGTGAPARLADVGIRQGRIAQIGRLASAKAKTRLDASGLVLAPGFIDVHTHADDIAARPMAENFIRMGVTSIVAGNCGSSAINIGAALERVRDAGVTVNFATLIGHNTVRASVMGSARRDPTITELRRMQVAVFKGMAEGAVGFSTGLQYVPGIYARTNELVELARTAANEGGLYATHMRNEGTELEAAIQESIRLARRNDMRLQISHLKIDSPSRWGQAAAVLTLIDDARAAGVRVQADVYAYTAGASSLSIRFPAWALEGGAARVRARLVDPDTWAKIKVEMQVMLAERGFSDLAWATVARYRPDPSLEGRTMGEVAEKFWGSRSAGAQLEAARALMIGGGASMVYHFMDEADVTRILQHAAVSIASDASVIDPGAGTPHPRGYGNTARVLGTYVRDRKVLSLEEAVHKMTSLPAAHFGFDGRGVIREGAIADLVVFDPATVADRATFAAPHAFPTGIPHVVVHGQLVVHGGKLTGARPGQLLVGRQ